MDCHLLSMYGSSTTEDNLLKHTLTAYQYHYYMLHIGHTNVSHALTTFALVHSV